MGFGAGKTVAAGTAPHLPSLASLFIHTLRVLAKAALSRHRGYAVAGNEASKNKQAPDEDSQGLLSHNGYVHCAPDLSCGFSMCIG